MLTLRRLLLANAASCLAFGTLFAVDSVSVAAFLGAEPPVAPTVIRVLGLALLANGAHLAWAAMQRRPGRWLIAWFCAGDLLWAAGTSTLALIGGWVTSNAGVAMTLIVALLVGAVGVAQSATHKAQFTNA